MALDSLQAGLGHDDLMNLTHAWRPGLESLLWDNVRFYEVGSAHRPFGELFYWILFYLFRFDAFPYRVACLALLCGNAALLYWVCRSLDMSRRAAVLACFFHGYHYGFWALYYNTGTCYDLLAFWWFYLALGLYVRMRTQGRLTVAGVAILCVAMILSLNSKELGVSLPALLVAYEVLWRRRDEAGQRWRAGLAVASVGAIVAVYAAGHFASPESLSNLSSYRPDLSVATYWAFLERTFAEVFYAFDLPGWLVAAGACMAMVGVVALSRQRAAAFGVIAFATGVVPIAFIAPRALYAAYMPLAGLAMAASAGVWAAADWLGRRSRPAAGSAFVAVVVSGVLWTHLWVRQHGAADVMMAQQAVEIEAIRTRLLELVPDPPRGSRILLLEDPFLQLDDPLHKEWASVFLVELLYEDVHVDQAFRLDPPPDEGAVAGYDYVLTSHDARLERVQ